MQHHQHTLMFISSFRTTNRNVETTCHRASPLSLNQNIKLLTICVGHTASLSRTSPIQIKTHAFTKAPHNSTFGLLPSILPYSIYTTSYCRARYTCIKLLELDTKKQTPPLCENTKSHPHICSTNISLIGSDHVQDRRTHNQVAPPARVHGISISSYARMGMYGHLQNGNVRTSNYRGEGSDTTVDQDSLYHDESYSLNALRVSPFCTFFPLY